MTHTHGYAALSDTAPLEPFRFERREPGSHDVQIEILFCGVCHSDIHSVRNEWKSAVYPMVPGHEIIGKVTKIGKAVKSFKPGDLAAVGCMVDSCRTCPACRDHLEQYCEKQCTFTYNSKDKHTGKMTYGGYSTLIVVDESFVLHVPKNLDLAAAAPLLCAGITMYSPLRHWKVGKGSKVGIVGLGGLGHMGIQLAHAMGAHVVLFTSSAGKIKDGKRFGANEVVVSSHEGELKKHLNSFDLIIDTVSVPHNLDIYLELLKREGTLCLIGVPDSPHPSPNIGNLIFGRKSLAGSLIGGIQETQEMLDFCSHHKIACEVEIIPIQKINEAYERMIKNDVKYRFVIDMASLK